MIKKSIENNNENNFYVYALQDIRKPGEHQYRDSLIFNYEPYWIGKGKNYRINDHDGEIHTKSRTRKANKIRKIFRETGQLPLKIKLYENLTEEQAFETEIFLIKQIGRLDHGRGPLTNATDGGEGTSGMSEDSRRRIGLAHKGVVLSKETLEKMSTAKKGKKLSDETKKKLSMIRSGQKHSEESKRKISSGNSGKIRSEEIKKKMSESKSGKKHPNYGKKYSEETRQKMSSSQSGKHSTEETKKKISKINLGKQHSKESKMKMSESHKGKKHSEETKRKIQESCLKRKQKDKNVNQ